MHGGGAERIAALLANDWTSRGHCVHIVATFSGRGECGYTLAPGVKLTFLADVVGSTKRSLLNQLKRFKAVRDLVRQERPDAILSFLSLVNIAVVLATLGLGVRVVVSERIYPPHQPLGALMEWLRKLVYKRCAHVVMQTAKGKDWLARTIPGARGTVIFNPVSYPLPASLAPEVPVSTLTEGSKLVIGVGRLTPQKGFHQLTEAFAQIAHDYPEWTLAILGEGEQRSELEAKIAEHKLQNRIHLLGRVGNMAQWYERADLFVMSSRYEGFPNALVEAMSYGVPVLSTACDTGPDEIVEHCQNGMLVPVKSECDELQAGLETMMRNPTLRKRLGNMAKQVRQRYAMEKISNEWESVLGIDSVEQA
ncbi:MAG: glycosyltransferase family 4 protein [Pseudomonadaceae bacterium]|nr:glycosyltransferase family 4 protein [Pseudomonadaceae bacterium]